MRDPRRRSGVTIIELMVVISIIAVVVAVAAPKIGTGIRASRMDRAQRVVAGDLRQASSLASRIRRPVRFSRLVAGDTIGYQAVDVVNNKRLFMRNLGRKSDYALTALTMRNNNAPVTFFPTGLASAATTVYITSSTRTDSVMMTRVGFVRAP